ncbi:MAG: 4-alpha-glucanotransferase [Peptoniphilaceae bacterium]|nr:4-alpha-glucanotransferase [Peptoniphilaceae bacterium]
MMAVRNPWRGLFADERPLSREEEVRHAAQAELARERRRLRVEIEKTEPVRLTMVDYSRGVGILLPIFSLPSPHGIGTFGAAAFQFIDFLAEAGVRYWQILPLNPTGYGESPYASHSSWAGNPFFIDLDLLVEAGWLAPEDLIPLDYAVEMEERVNGHDQVAYRAVKQYREKLLKKAFRRAGDENAVALRAFFADHDYWLHDYALYRVIKEEQDDAVWTAWPEDLKRRDPEALAAFAASHERELAYVYWEQFLFFRQWEALKARANEKGILIIGDIPIYVALDSADCWANPEMFQLDDDFAPKAEAGVPPDAFSEDGQLWGNPVYDWDALKATGYSFWISRLAHTMRLYNVIRLDHFIGFSRYWSVPAGESTAKNGTYIEGPGMDFFRAAERALGPLPILVEDLGVMDEQVIRLRRQTGFPGMCPIEFAFGEADSEYLPHNHERRSSVYTSTHDSDTLKGWWDEVATEEEKERMISYFGLNVQEGMLWGILRGVCGSVAELCIFSMQDLLMLGNEARINRPGTVGGNWSWRLERSEERHALAKRIRTMAMRYGRIS